MTCWVHSDPKSNVNVFAKDSPRHCALLSQLGFNLRREISPLLSWAELPLSSLIQVLGPLNASGHALSLSRPHIVRKSSPFCVTWEVNNHTGGKVERPLHLLESCLRWEGTWMFWMQVKIEEQSVKFVRCIVLSSYPLICTPHNLYTLHWGSLIGQLVIG